MEENNQSNEPLSNESATVAKTGVDVVLDNDRLDGSAAHEKMDNDANIWYLAEGVKGEGPVPEFFQKEKYGTMWNQAKAHGDVRRELSKRGAPAEYKLEDLPEEYKEHQLDDESLKSFQEIAKDSGLSNDAYNNIVQYYVKSQQEQIQAFEAADEKAIAEEMHTLGPDAKEKVDGLASFLEANVSEEAASVIKEYTDSARFFNAIKELVGKISDKQLAPSQSGTHITADERYGLRDMMSDPRYNYDPVYQKVVNDKYAAAYGK